MIERVLMERVMTLACQDRGFGFGRVVGMGWGSHELSVNSTLEKEGELL